MCSITNNLKQEKRHSKEWSRMLYRRHNWFQDEHQLLKIYNEQADCWDTIKFTSKTKYEHEKERYQFIYYGNTVKYYHFYPISLSPNMDRYNIDMDDILDLIYLKHHKDHPNPSQFHGYQRIQHQNTLSDYISQIFLANETVKIIRYIIKLLELPTLIQSQLLRDINPITNDTINDIIYDWKDYADERGQQWFKLYTKRQQIKKRDDIYFYDPVNIIKENTILYQELLDYVNINVEALPVLFDYPVSVKNIRKNIIKLLINLLSTSLNPYGIYKENFIDYFHYTDTLSPTTMASSPNRITKTALESNIIIFKSCHISRQQKIYHHPYHINIKSNYKEINLDNFKHNYNVRNQSLSLININQNITLMHYAYSHIILLYIIIFIYLLQFYYFMGLDQYIYIKSAGHAISLYFMAFILNKSLLVLQKLYEFYWKPRMAGQVGHISLFRTGHFSLKSKQKQGKNNGKHSIKELNLCEYEYGLLKDYAIMNLYNSLEKLLHC